MRDETRASYNISWMIAKSRKMTLLAKNLSYILWGNTHRAVQTNSRYVKRIPLSINTVRRWNEERPNILFCTVCQVNITSKWSFTFSFRNVCKINKKSKNCYLLNVWKLIYNLNKLIWLKLFKSIIRQWKNVPRRQFLVGAWRLTNDRFSLNIGLICTHTGMTSALLFLLQLDLAYFCPKIFLSIFISLHVPAHKVEKSSSALPWLDLEFYSNYFQ